MSTLPIIRRCRYCDAVLEDDSSAVSVFRRYCGPRCAFADLDEPEERPKRSEDEYASNGVNRRDFS